MRSALSWALGSGRIETALRLGGALEWFWRVRGHFVEGGRWLEETLSADEGVPDLVRAKALCSAGYLAHMQGDFERARRLLQKSLELYRELGDEEGTARSLHYLGWIDLNSQGHIERARRLLEESLEIDGGTLIPLRLTQTDLAGLVGASTARVNQALGYYRKRGSISLNKEHRIIVREEESLARRAR
jgi:tetratricopeptide (TPR) repeat protein